MRRADRLFRIVQYLRGGRLVTASRLAEWLEVSERTIYRDIVDLKASGVPIDGEAGVGYIMREGFDLPPLMFSRDEITALVAGARLIRAWGGLDMARAAEEALVKIEAVLPEADRSRAGAVQIHAIAVEMTEKLRVVLDRLETAVEDRNRVTFDYLSLAGARTRRTVRPLGLWFWGKVWTLIAWCELRDDFRMFRADRIDALETGERFRPERHRQLADFYRRMEQQGGRGPEPR